ncbi:TauD/TfdA family dioxygenase [Rhodospirillaceae bacterium KN72]|uniref:TauD/TfdA family dioxygenase n=1 Tax=Pacificispira spongiicola TaxID=2729598 RepID=A0A7Y0E2L0_9PROT|nr:TauD/TfdA family dioxygenase [Pacificispira spongiicola]NMM46075.1 TauD/TfdA family dioxygenase [Pacificispira spongiicola]
MMLRVPAGDGTAWARENAADIQAIAEKAGVVLLRGFDLPSPVAFRAVCQAIEPDLRPYTGGDSPRTGVTDQVYTSTEYDADLEVFLHNELSYAGWSPRIVFFGCLIPSAEGGETHIADGRQVYQAIPSDIRDRFETRGIVYLQHLWDADGKPGIGKSWQETFETDSREAVEAYLRQSGMDWTWTDYGIRTRAPHDAIVTHPKTGEKCWWNQADQWHRDLGGVKTSFGGSDDPRFDPSTAGEGSLGNHVIYGDGTEIDADDLRTIRSVTRSLEVAFPWEAGDVMVVDNVLAMHGRKPFKGERRILVAMA